MRYSFCEQLKSKKHPKYKGVYIVNAYGKTFHVQHFLDENMEHKGEWSILEITENEPYGEWVDTVCGKAVALIRIKQLYENKENEMRNQTPWTNNKEEKAQDHKLLEMSKLLEDYLEHKFDVITDSDWFEDLVEEKLTKILERRNERL
tara:strand:+ start:583 stop:1026 length:444 start_codon:yes stop_codon:yes gene_type:complete